ncbi:putative modification methylase [Colletotrichum fructicola]|nr:putative modification methylase [Colletotrichum fructicola]KAF4883972.1 putative modification methylase [Colletotrichum fructicola]KAF4920503.1 putative modification methylase [Colletotrichum fructicola]
MFCRFARSVHDDSIDLIPISQHLLPPQDRRSNPGFTGTASEGAIDLTPGVLGLMEGFCSAGYQPFAAFGFNESSDATWKIRHQTCPLFDGSFPEILEDIDSGKLLGPSWPSEDSPTTVLADLSFENPPTSQTGFVCSLPPRAVSDENTTSIRCYNYNTGRKIPEEKARIVDLDSNDINVTTHSRHHLVHPTRLDSLTVRELARIQGFPDDFVFYGSERQQYEHVTFAQPPAAARAAAECIKTVIKRFREVKLRDGEGSQRPNKRRREDNGPSQEVSREGA